MAHTIALIQGDGIGPKLSAAVFEAVHGTAPDIGGTSTTTERAGAIRRHIEYTGLAPFRPA